MHSHESYKTIVAKTIKNCNIPTVHFLYDMVVKHNRDTTILIALATEVLYDP